MHLLPSAAYTDPFSPFKEKITLGYFVQIARFLFLFVHLLLCVCEASRINPHVPSRKSATLPRPLMLRKVSCEYKLQPLKKSKREVEPCRQKQPSRMPLFTNFCGNF